MKIIFKCPKLIGKQLFKKSPVAQEVDNKFADHWFVKAGIKDGDLIVVDEDPKPAPSKAAKAAKAEKAEKK